jgi:putative salt-induced outer membrane protein YdiY
MRLRFILTICLALSYGIVCAQGAEFEELRAEFYEVVPEVQPEIQFDSLNWKRRSDEVQQLLGAPKLDFEKVGYQIGSLEALTKSLNAVPKSFDATTAAVEPDVSFGSTTLHWSQGKLELRPDAGGAGSEIKQLQYQPAPHPSVGSGLGSGLQTPEQVFAPPFDPALREYIVKPGHWYDILPGTLWQEYADWFHSGFLGWTERLELGGSFLEGNTNQEAFNTAAKFSRNTEFTATQINLGGNHAQSQMVTTANRWFADTTTDFKREGNWLYFVRSLHEYDQFTNLDYRGTASLGTGYRFFNEENQKLIVRYGPGVTQEVFHSPRLVRTSPDLFAEVETKWMIGPRVVFEEKATLHPNITNFGMLRVLNTTGFLIPLDNQKRWNLKVGFRYEYNGRPNLNRQPSDFATNLNIVYSRN